VPAESHIVSTAADLASQVRARRIDPVAIASATLARIAGDSRAVAAFRHVRHNEALPRQLSWRNARTWVSWRWLEFRSR
jgi:Asp-tRNA(Asn)/Glu-tRNA(Gln) amidotransferase A subunit family amidase